MVNVFSPAKETLFYDLLGSMFVGSDVVSSDYTGAIKLVKMKYEYYKAFQTKLRSIIGEYLSQYPDFSEELFDKLYTFFSMFISKELGALYFCSNRVSDVVIERIYAQDKESALYFRTKNSYYVKSDIILRNLEISAYGYRFLFDASSVEGKFANEKKRVIFELKNVDSEKQIVFKVHYVSGKANMDIEQILSKLHSLGVNIDENQLKQVFNTFLKQNIAHLFVHKNPRRFLREQFDNWLHQYVLSSGLSYERYQRIYVLREVAYEIIDFISRFEDEIRKMVEKIKFVLGTYYLIGLDRINNMEIIERILNHKNMDKQIEYWRLLGLVDENFDKEHIIVEDIFGKRLSEKYAVLPIDTRFFKDLEHDILSQFDNLDESLDGVLIKGENLQALNTILKKYMKRVALIYIDPPYNTGNDDFAYIDSFESSVWLSMMYNRLELAKKFLRPDGLIFVSIDDNELANLIHIMDELFNRVAVITWKKLYGGKNNAKNFSKETEYILCYSNASSNVQLIKDIHVPEKENRYKYVDERGRFLYQHLCAKSGNERNRYQHTFANGVVWEAPPGSYPRFSKQRLIQLEQEGRIIFPGDTLTTVDGKKVKYDGKAPVFKLYLHEVGPGKKVSNFWDGKDVGYNAETTKEFEDMFGPNGREIKNNINPKPISLMKHIIDISTEHNSIVFDFFAGSGTTAVAVIRYNQEHNTNLKFLLVEMAEYFDSVIVPRIIKTGYATEWKDGKPEKVASKGIFVKCYTLEQFTDTLSKVEYSSLFHDVIADEYEPDNYMFYFDQKLLGCVQTDGDTFKVDLSKLYPNIDIAETLSNLKGKWIKRLSKYEVEFEDGEKIDLRNIDIDMIKPLIWWDSRRDET